MSAPTASRRFVFPPTPQSARRSRTAVSEFLAEAGRPELVESAALLCSEAVTNAVLHAHTDVVVEAFLRPDGALHVEVSDTHPGVPVRPAPSRDADTGLGMVLIESLATAFGVDLSATLDGKTVWFRIGGPVPDQPSTWGALDPNGIEVVRTGPGTPPVQ